jgi:methylated-DNA-[protein]-cysteine S-methyltransferase
VAASARGVVAVEWLTGEDAFSAGVARRLGAVPLDMIEVGPRDRRRRQLDAAIDALATFLDGRPPKAGPPPALDLSDRPVWDREVLEAVAAIPWGETASYGEIARRVGSPRAARAVGGAVGRNPISLLVPCHRVIAADGTIGGYGSDGWLTPRERLALKQDLLRREGLRVPFRDR